MMLSLERESSAAFERVSSRIATEVARLEALQERMVQAQQEIDQIRLCTHALTVSIPPVYPPKEKNDRADNDMGVRHVSLPPIPAAAIDSKVVADITHLLAQLATELQQLHNATHNETWRIPQSGVTNSTLPHRPKSDRQSQDAETITVHNTIGSIGDAARIRCAADIMLFNSKSIPYRRYHVADNLTLHPDAVAADTLHKSILSAPCALVDGWNLPSVFPSDVTCHPSCPPYCHVHSAVPDEVPLDLPPIMPGVPNIREFSDVAPSRRPPLLPTAPYAHTPPTRPPGPPPPAHARLSSAPPPPPAHARLSSAPPPPPPHARQQSAPKACSFPQQTAKTDPAPARTTLPRAPFQEGVSDRQTLFAQILQGKRLRPVTAHGSGGSAREVFFSQLDIRSKHI
eukprot:GEMP01040167.1.p1 GENE.GEMP01040167.1~~GEMP01040167.1.p1  ORF type:complete len:400 (+),score=102.07 GEMP01040167.1:45-1244(+)